MTDWKHILNWVALIGIVVVLVALVATLVENPSPDVCDRLDPCCYGQGKPDFIYHATDPPIYKYWEKIDRDDPNNRTLFVFWHYNANDTALFYDNTTKVKILAESLERFKVWVDERPEMLDGISTDGYCWLDRMVDYLD